MFKSRLDIELVNRHLVPTRNQAQTLIRAGLVLINQQKAISPSQMVDQTTIITITQPLKYVSRGGLKLEHALKIFNIKPQDYICLDIGASTGGFTDCLLQHGARKVYALDVGHGQLATKLRQDNRVINLEKTHWKTIEQLPEQLDLITIDVSFISLTKILDHLQHIATDNDCDLAVIALLKPQFEAGPANLRKGVVKDPKIHQQVLANFVNYCQQHSWQIVDSTPSPIKGPKGNVEFLFYLQLKK